MNILMEQYETETGKSALSDFSPSLEYVKWLEEKVNEIGKKFCDSAEKYAFHDKTGNFYYYVKDIIGESFARKMQKMDSE